MKKFLTKREIEIVILIGKGLRNHEIAAELNISLRTVKSHIESIFAKLEVQYRIQAVLKAIVLEIIELKDVV